MLNKKRNLTFYWKKVSKSSMDESPDGEDNRALGTWGAGSTATSLERIPTMGGIPGT